MAFGKSCEDLSWNHRTSTPFRSETNGIAERAARRVKEGTSAVLLQSGLDQTNGGLIPWNAIAICEMYKTSWQMGKLLTRGDSENHAKGPVIPFGAMVEYYPISSRDQSTLHQCGKKVLPRICFGYELITEGIWKGDTLVADIEALEKMDALEIHPRRINTKEVLTPQR